MCCPHRLRLCVTNKNQIKPNYHPTPTQSGSLGWVQGPTPSICITIFKDWLATSLVALSRLSSWIKAVQYYLNFSNHAVSWEVSAEALLVCSTVSGSGWKEEFHGLFVSPTPPPAPLVLHKHLQVLNKGFLLLLITRFPGWEHIWKRHVMNHTEIAQ